MKNFKDESPEITRSNSTMRINIQALRDRDIAVEVQRDGDDNVTNLYITCERTIAFRTSIILKQLIDAGLKPVQANELVESLLDSANTKLIHNAIEETKYLE